VFCLKRILKCFTCLILCFTLVFSTFYFENEKAEAIAPALLIALPYIATALVGAGVVFYNQDAAKSACTDFWNKASSAVKDQFTQMATEATGAVIVGTALYQTMTGYKDQLADGTITTLPGADPADAYTWATSPSITSGTYYSYNAQHISSGRLALKATHLYMTASTGFLVEYHLNGSSNNSYLRLWYNAGYATIGGWQDPNAIYQPGAANIFMPWSLVELVLDPQSHLSIIVDGVTVLQDLNSTYQFTGRFGAGTTVYTDWALTQASFEPIPVAGNVSTMSNPPNYSQKKLAVPVNGIEDLVNVEASDLSVSAPTAAELDHAVDPIEGATDSGILSGIWSILEQIRSTLVSLPGTITSAISSAITTAFVPSATYLDTWVSARTAVATGKGIFTFGDQIGTAMGAFGTSLQESEDWEGIKANFGGWGGVGEVLVVDPTYVNHVRVKLKFWIAGFMWLLTGIFVLKKSSAIISGQGGT